MTLREAIEQCLSEAQQDKALRTLEGYRFDLLALPGQDKPAKALTGPIVRAHFVKMVAEGKAAQTRNHHRSALAFLGAWGVAAGIWPTSPAAHAPKAKVGKRLPRPFDPAEFAKVMALPLAGVDRYLRSLLAYTGLRVSEAGGLRVGHIRGDHLRVIGKGDRERLVPILPELAAVLPDLTDMIPSAYVLGHRMRRERIEERVRAWGVTAGVTDCTPHRFRHWYATELRRRGADLREIQALLGHASLATTALYLGITLDDLHTAARRLSAA